MNTTPCKIRLVVSGLLIIAILTACTPAGTPASTPIPTSPPTQKSQPTETAQPTGTPVPSWVAEFSGPILLAIQDRPPDFQDDFSQPDSEWVSSTCGEEPCGSIAIVDGAITMNLESGQYSVNTKIRGREFQNFVLQVDVDLQQLDKEKLAEIGWGSGYSFTLHPHRGWELMYLGLQEPIYISAGAAPVDLSHTVTITIIYKGTEIAVYLNGNPITYYSDIEKPSNTLISIGLWAPPPNVESHSITYDNLSIWNLDTVFPPPTATPDPLVTGFTEPLLLAIQDRPPDFQDDFSQSDTGWVFITGHGDGTVEIANGVMMMGAVSGQNAIAIHKEMTFNNFILQVDVNFLELEDRISAGIWWRRYDGVGEVFGLDNDGSWTLKRNDRQDPQQFESGYVSVDLSKPVTITIVSRGTEFAVYMNNIPLAYHNDIGRPPANGIELNFFNHADNRINSAVAYDNLSVWNLDSILPPPIVTPVPTATPHPLVASFGDPILLAIQDRPPDFQDDFSQGSSGWITSPGGTVNIANGILALSGGVGQGVDFVKVPRTNFTNFVVQVEVNTQKLIHGCEATIQWRGGADGPGRIFGLQNGKWGLYSIYQNQDDLPFPAGIPTNGPLPLSASGVYSITLISREPEIAVYLNGEPITYVMDIVRPPDPGFHFGLWYPGFCTAEYDNLKVWDLDKLK